MKIAMLTSLILLTFNVMAGGYYNYPIDTYDQESGLYYKGIHKTEDSGLLSSGNTHLTNINIFDPATQKSTLLFQGSENLRITDFIFEIEIKNKEVILFQQYSNRAKNNINITARLPKNKILVVTNNLKAKELTFYTANKDGSNLQKTKTISSNKEWHIDVKNSVIRITSQAVDRILIEEIDW